MQQYYHQSDSPLSTESNMIIEEMSRAASPYSPEEKKVRIERYRSKKNQRNYNKKIKVNFLFFYLSHLNIYVVIIIIIFGSRVTLLSLYHHINNNLCKLLYIVYSNIILKFKKYIGLVSPLCYGSTTLNKQN